MSIPRRAVLGTLFVISLAGCEKASAPPPEAATAPAETAAPPPSATSPVVETTPSTGAPEPTPTAASAPVIPPAASTASATPSAAPAAGGESPAATHGSAHASKEHAEATAATANASPATEGPAPDDACQTKNFHYTQVASACKSGGRKAVKAIMKGVVKKAKAAGTDLQCTSCHQDMKDFHLKSNAVGDLKNWL
jgi:type IV secretory pathway VirB10-like protein